MKLNFFPFSENQKIRKLKQKLTILKNCIFFLKYMMHLVSIFIQCVIKGFTGYMAIFWSFRDAGKKFKGNKEYFGNFSNASERHLCGQGQHLVHHRLYTLNSRTDGRIFEFCEKKHTCMKVIHYTLIEKIIKRCCCVTTS